MKSETRKFLAVGAAAFFLAVAVLAMQFDEALNAVAVLQVGSMTDAASAGKVVKSLSERGGVSPVRVDLQSGMVIAFFDARAVDPRSLVETVGRAGFPSRIRDLLTMKEYTSLVAGGAGCGSGGCDNCPKKR